jgi:dCTP diphosphatase
LESHLQLEKFSESEYINIGEELADVFIYTTRLAEVCDIDLSRCIVDYNALESSIRSKRDVEWQHLELDNILVNNHAVAQIADFTSVRHLVLDLQRAAGSLCSLFRTKHELDVSPQLSTWSDMEVSNLGKQLAVICTIVAYIAQQCKHSLGRVIQDKLCKNEAKYPADLVRGSSAKYTQYKNGKAKLDKQSMQHVAVGVACVTLAMGIGVCLGLYVLPKANIL